VSVRLVAALTVFAVVVPAAALAEVETIAIDAHGRGQPFPHFWERMFGSGHAPLTLRESWRNDLRGIKRVSAIEYVRFHDILHDDLGVYDEDAQGRPIYNFSYVDEIYDGLLENGVRPFVELSFMPKKLAWRPAYHEFWYQPIVAPPKKWERWGELIHELVKHLVERYGLDEVSKWYFEVWNEPNIHFWVGVPKDKTYFQLYDHAVRAIKRVSPRLRVGGPATAQAAWVDKMIAHAVEASVPLDFVSTHVYANDTAEDVFGTHEKITRRDMVCRAVKKVHDQIQASAMPKLPLIWSEFNASWKNEPEITDALMMGPWLADTVRQCDGLVDMMSYWTFSDVFEEQGVSREPFYGGFGAIAAGGLPKPVYNAFGLLHRLGDERLPSASSSALVTRHKDGRLAIALWNLQLPDEHGAARRATLTFTGLGPRRKKAQLTRLDATHGSLLDAYAKMGRPRYPTRQQQQELRKAAVMPADVAAPIVGDRLEVEIPINGMVLVEVR
jgi:xylan 1,4-beta-xylosidase